MECWSDIEGHDIAGLSRAMVRRRTSARKKRTAYPALGAAPAKKHGAWVIVILAALVVVNLYVFVWDKKTGVRAIKQQAEAQGVPALALPSQPLAASGSATPSPPPIASNSVIEGKVSKSDTLGKLLRKHLGPAESDEIIRALSGVLDFRTIRTGQSYRIERGPDGRVKLFELEVAKGHVRAERQPSGELVGKLAT